MSDKKNFDSDVLYSKLDQIYDRLNEAQEYECTDIYKIGLCVGEARQVIYDMLNYMDDLDFSPSYKKPELESDSEDEE